MARNIPERKSKYKNNEKHDSGKKLPNLWTNNQAKNIASSWMHEAIFKIDGTEMLLGFIQKCFSPKHWLLFIISMFSVTPLLASDVLFTLKIEICTAVSCLWIRQVNFEKFNMSEIIISTCQFSLCISMTKNLLKTGLAVQLQ